MKNIFLILILISTLTFGAKVARDKPTSKHASTHESSGTDTVDHDLLTNFEANEHIDWTSDQGATNIDDTNIPAHTGDVTGTTALSLDSAAISGQSLVTSVGEDHFLIEDATDGTLKKALVSDVLGGGTDAAAIHDDTASEISAITEKTIPVAGDFLIIEDSAAGNVKKRIQVGNLPSASTPIDTVQTTDATPATIKTLTAGTDFNDDDVIRVTMNCESNQTDGSKGGVFTHVAGYRKDGAATTVLIGETDVVNLSDAPQAYKVQTVLSGSNILLQVVGAASETVNHDCQITTKVRNAT